jgi:hypothetical protein
VQSVYITSKRFRYNLARSQEYRIVYLCLARGKYSVKCVSEQKVLCRLINKIGTILLYREKRATFVNNLYNFIKIGKDLLRQIRKGPYLEKVKWAVCKSYSEKDETAELRIFAL